MKLTEAAGTTDSWVHDELVLEGPEGDAKDLGELVCREMEGVAKLAVPLVAEVGSGSSRI